MSSKDFVQRRFNEIKTNYCWTKKKVNTWQKWNFDDV